MRPRAERARHQQECSTSRRRRARSRPARALIAHRRKLARAAVGGAAHRAVVPGQGASRGRGGAGARGGAAGRAAMLQAAWERLRGALGRTLDAFHGERPDLPGIGIEQLRKGEKPLLPAPLFLAALRKLAQNGDVALDRTWVRRPHHEVEFSGEEERVWALILPRLSGEPYRPPRVRDIARAMSIDEGLVRRLMRL